MLTGENNKLMKLFIIVNKRDLCALKEIKEGNKAFRMMRYNLTYFQMNLSRKLKTKPKQVLASCFEQI